MQKRDEQSSNLGGESSTKPVISTIDQSKGARPKIRNPKEAKRRRFVMKQAKTISKPQPLESVSESEESQSLLSKATDPHEGTSSSNKGPEFFGVRSYVHTFYEAMAMDNLQGYEDIEHFGYIIPKRKRRKQVLCWRLTLASGILVLLMGIIVLSVGFFVPKKKEIIDNQEDISIIDKSFQAFNQDLDICKMVGLFLFCTGGLMIAGVFLALTCVYRGKKEDPLSAEEIPLTTAPTESTVNAQAEEKVPVTEEVAAVQPKRVDPDEVVMTNAGLCKVP